jgi:hypothetical protein
MPTRLVALDEGTDIVLDRPMLVVGRHPQCDARLDSIRVSRRHCCMTQDKESGDVIVRDLGSTNGIRINGQRLEWGKLRHGDELSIAHIRYRMETGSDEQATLAETMRGHRDESHAPVPPINLMPGPGAPPVAMAHVPSPVPPPLNPAQGGVENHLAAAFREMLPASLAERFQIQVIVRGAEGADAPASLAGQPEAPPRAQDAPPCPPDSSP